MEVPRCPGRWASAIRRSGPSAHRAQSPIDRSWSCWNRRPTVLSASRSGNGTSPDSCSVDLHLELARRARLTSPRCEVSVARSCSKRPAVGEEHLHQPLELERRRRRRLAEPRAQGLPPVAVMRVDRPRSGTGHLLLARGEPGGDEPLRLVVQLPLGAGPEPAERALHLLGQLVGGPGPQRQEAEDRLGGGGRARSSRERA